jgi:hypothetical protein
MRFATSTPASAVWPVALALSLLLLAAAAVFLGVKRDVVFDMSFMPKLQQHAVPASPFHRRAAVGGISGATWRRRCNCDCSQTQAALSPAHVFAAHSNP